MIHGSTMNSPGSRSNWLRTVLTDTETFGMTAATCALIRAVTCSRSARAKRTNADSHGMPPDGRENAKDGETPLPVRYADQPRPARTGRCQRARDTDPRFRSVSRSGSRSLPGLVDLEPHVGVTFPW